MARKGTEMDKGQIDPPKSGQGDVLQPSNDDGFDPMPVDNLDFGLREGTVLPADEEDDIFKVFRDLPTGSGTPGTNEATIGTFELWESRKGKKT